LQDTNKAAVECGSCLLQEKNTQDPNCYRFLVMTRRMISPSLQRSFCCSPRLFQKWSSRRVRTNFSWGGRDQSRYMY
jgi:hypothetical protein